MKRYIAAGQCAVAKRVGREFFARRVSMTLPNSVLNETGSIICTRVRRR